MGKQWKQCLTLFWGAPKSLQMVTAAMKLKDAYSLEGKLLIYYYEAKPWMMALVPLAQFGGTRSAGGPEVL